MRRYNKRHFITLPKYIIQEWFINFNTWHCSELSYRAMPPLVAYIKIYQSPLTLTELFQHSLINVSYLTACYLYQVMMTLHFLNDVANDAESIQKSKITS